VGSRTVLPHTLWASVGSTQSGTQLEKWTNGVCVSRCVTGLQLFQAQTEAAAERLSGMRPVSTADAVRCSEPSSSGLSLSVFSETELLICCLLSLLTFTPSLCHCE
jgi:hypothetical protein